MGTIGNRLCPIGRAGERKDSNTCDAILNHDRETSFRVNPFAIAYIALTSPFDFGKFVVTYGLEFSLIDARELNDVFVANDNG